MKLVFKKHASFPDIMSADVTLFKNKKYHITLQEYYDPHYIEFKKWVRDTNTSFYVLRKWHKVPLSVESFKILKHIKSPGNINAIAHKLRKKS